MSWRNFVLRILLLVPMTVATISCAQYSVKTNKALDFTEKLRSVYAWSGIGSVEPLTRRLPFAEDTFENLFNSALRRKLSENGVTCELRNFSPNTDSMAALARFEGTANPEYRLLLVPTKYKTIKYGGATNLDVLYLDKSVIKIKDARRVWRSEFVVNANTAPGAAWREAGADKLAELIVSTLVRDGLL